MGGAEQHPDAPVLPDLRPGPGEPGEQPLRQTQGGEKLPVKLSGFRVHQAHGGGVGVLPGLPAAEAVHQVFRHHQQVRDPLQPAPFQVVAELVDGVEGLELDAGAAVEGVEGRLFVDLPQDRPGAGVPVGVAGPDRRVPPQQDVVHPPGVDGETFEPGKLPEGGVNARPDRALQSLHVPDEVALPLPHTVGEAEDLLCLYGAVLLPAHDVPPAGGADVDCQIIFHTSFSIP